MKERNFDDMIAYFNRRVSEMDIAQDYKMELLGMVTALGYKHEKTAQQWIPCKDHLPLFDFTDVLLLYHDKMCGCENDYYIVQAYTVRGQWRPALRINDSDMRGLEPVAWCELPAPYKEA